MTDRFLAADPVLDATDPQSLNGYDYADNNPIAKSDPTGLHNDDRSKYGGHESNYNPDAGDGSTTRRNCWGAGGENLCGVPSGGTTSNMQKFFNSFQTSLGGPVGTVGSGPSIPLAPGSLALQELIKNPQGVLQGLNPAQLLELLGDNLPADSTISPGQSKSAGLGPGWKLIIKGKGNVTVRWSPGTARTDNHPDGPYWRFSSGSSGKLDHIDAGAWDDGPPEYVWRIPPLPSIGDGTSSAPDPPATDQGPCACGGPRTGGGLFEDDNEPEGPGKILEDFDI